MSRIFVTGGSGRLGRSVVAGLVEAGHKVISVDRDAIPAEQLPRIFEKFFQADNQNAAAHAGSGLGLAIARTIVEAHGGQIACDSTPGEGTTFTIVLPNEVTSRRPSVQVRAIAGVA